MFDALISWLKGGRTVQGQPSIQPNLSTVDLAQHNLGATANIVNFENVSTDVLVVPIVGSIIDIQPDFALTPGPAIISGGGVPQVKGSNSPNGGKCQ
jgi:hypothetical protein